MQYINYNGNIYPRQEKLMPATNRGVSYGDGFFESMVMFDRKVPLLEYHWSRIEFTTEVLSAFLPRRFDLHAFQTMLLDLASVNDAVKNARVRVQFYRKGEGLYFPEEDELGYIISMEALNNSRFDAGPGLKAGMREDCYKPVSMISDIKHSSALMYVIAAQYAKAEGWDECILLNHYGQICEALAYNVIMVKGNKMATPNLDSGCVNGVMRSFMLWLMDGKIEEREIDMEELLNADEILLTNAVKGIHWVKELNKKTYKNKKALELTTLLNKRLLGL